MQNMETMASFIVTTKGGPVMIYSLKRIQRYHSLFVIIFAIVMFINTGAVHGEDNFLKPPSFVAEGMSFFNQELYSMLNYFELDNNNPIRNQFFTHYLSCYFEIDVNENYEKGEEFRRLNFLNMFNFQIWNNLRLSFFLTITGATSSFSYYDSLSLFYIDTAQGLAFLGAGLAYESDLFYIGAYTGLVGEDKFTRQSSVKLEQPAMEINKFSLAYTIIPIYYPQKLSFIHSVSALLSFNVFKLNGGYLELYSRNFSVLDRSANLAVYFKHEVFDPLAENNFYGVNALMQILPNRDTIQLSLDTGYQQFVNIQFDLNRFYQSTPYFNLGIRLNFKYGFFRANCMIDRNNLSFPNLDFSLGFTWPKYIASSGRFHINPARITDDNLRGGWGIKVLSAPLGFLK